MKKSGINKWLLILAIIILIVFMIYFFSRSTIFEGMTNNKKDEIPKKIWTFWDSPEVPDIVNQCIDTLREFNPDYDIVILNKTNISNYIPGVDFSKMKHINETPQRFSDMVRLHILSKEGGFWVDATIICQKPFEWIQEIQRNTGSEFVGYYINLFTLPHFLDTSPVVENWFFGCIKDSTFVKDWLNEFSTIVNYNTVEEYVDLQKTQIDFQNIDGPYYLSMHVAAQKILQTNVNKYKLHLLKADDTAFKYLVDNHWDGYKAIQQLLHKKYIDQPIIKLRGGERNIIKSLDYQPYFNALFEKAENK